MQWIDSAFYQFRANEWKNAFFAPAVVAVGGLLYAGVVSVSFLSVVGFKIIALMMACIPVIVAGLFIACYGAGQCWHLAASLTGADTREQVPSSWLETCYTGFHLLLFYAFCGIFLVSLSGILPYINVFLGLAFIFFHPILFSAMHFSTENRTFFGLLDGCVLAYEQFEKRYLDVWLQSTAYMVIVGAGVYALAMAMATATIVGIILLPGLITALVAGYCHLLSSFTEVAGYAATRRRYQMATPVTRTHPAQAPGRLVASESTPWGARQG